MYIGLIARLPSDDVRPAEADILAFEARMRQVTPTYPPGDLVDYRGDLYEIASYQTDPPGYWL